jgi:RNA 3'-terminal phosphate cyclase (ATP)
MDWHPGLWGRTRTKPAASTSTKRWVTHARHDQPSPHREVDPTVDPTEFDAGARGVVVATEPGSKLITLDGSSGEGGGQILRSALSLSLLTGQPFRIVKIRANRDKPGLRPQHLKAVEAAAMLGNAQVTGGAIGSRDLTFRPGKIEPRDLKIDIGTAGATALVLHTLHLPLALRAESPVRLSLTGGTYNESAPSFPFLEATWRAHMAALGMPVSVAMPAAGFYPQGGGTLEAWIEPATPQPLILEECGKLVKIRGMAETSRLQGVDRRMADQALARLADHGYEADIQTCQIPGIAPGASITLVAEFTNSPPAAFVGLGKRGKPAEAVAEDAVDQLLEHLEASAGAVDFHSADQLLLPLAFAEGRSVFTVTRVTEHLRTNVETIQAFLDLPIRVETFGRGEGGRVVVG